MTSTETHLYFVAIIPPKPILDEVHEFKLVVAEKFDSKHALRSPAHITLFPPFKADNELFELIDRKVAGVANSQAPFDVSLSGFGAFPPRVIFVKPEASVMLLALQSEIGNALHPITKSQYRPDRQFNPHMTIAHRDLTPGAFRKAWELFNGVQYARKFKASSVSVLLNGDAGWTVLREHNLNPAV